jgi:hypothetical protein
MIRAVPDEIEAGREITLMLIHLETAPTPEKDPDDERVWM